MESVKKINVLSVTDIIANVHADSETLRVAYKQQAKVTTENWKDILDNLKILIIFFSYFSKLKRRILRLIKGDGKRNFSVLHIESLFWVKFNFYHRAYL